MRLGTLLSTQAGAQPAPSNVVTLPCAPGHVNNSSSNLRIPLGTARRLAGRASFAQRRGFAAGFLGPARRGNRTLASSCGRVNIRKFLPSAKVCFQNSHLGRRIVQRLFVFRCSRILQLLAQPGQHRDMAFKLATVELRQGVVLGLHDGSGVQRSLRLSSAGNYEWPCALGKL